MTADEIRKALDLKAGKWNGENMYDHRANTRLLMEIAAQLAELNTNLKELTISKPDGG